MRAAVAYLPQRDSVTPPEGVRTVKAIHADLRIALEPIAAGEANALLVARLGAAGGSLARIVRLLEWLRQAEADLIAIDVGLDTGTASGRRMAQLLRAVARLEREPEDRRSRGRPGLGTDAPALAERIAAIRERGLRLHAIAATLNSERIPTPRGGAMGRPSSVQSALGYRRPRPPVPGAPPPHRHEKPPGHGPKPRQEPPTPRPGPKRRGLKGPR